MPVHPQDDHTLWIFYRYEIVDSSRMPIQALLVRKEMAGHPSCGAQNGTALRKARRTPRSPATSRGPSCSRFTSLQS